ncbi:MAG TPA: ATP synthase subunit I [Candidatus Acidoferrum sp.]|nr:ATP synthase subunit I [Candidatus Acidoferrum sp.]
MENTEHGAAASGGGESQPVYLQTEQRIAWLTLIFGGVAALAAAGARRWAWAEGLAIGAVLAWFNFRWLKRGLDALVRAAVAQQGAASPRVPLGTWFRLLFRYALIALCVYVIFEYLKVPLVSMLVGLCALGAATLAASLYEILHPLR